MNTPDRQQSRKSLACGPPRRESAAGRATAHELLFQTAGTRTGLRSLRRIALAQSRACASSVASFSEQDIRDLDQHGRRAVHEWSGRWSPKHPAKRREDDSLVVRVVE